MHTNTSAMEVAEKERTPGLSLGEEKNMVTQLLLVNITVFILLYFIKIIYLMEEYGEPAFVRDILSNTIVSATPSTLLSKPWTLLTAMFAHMDFWDIFSNMVWLFVFGTILQQRAGYKQIPVVYVLGSFAGYATYMAAVNLLPGVFPAVTAGTGIMGAHAGVMAMAAGVTFLSPGLRVFPQLWRGGVPVWIFFGIFLLLHLASVSVGDGSISHLAFMTGGAIAGALLAIAFKNGSRFGDKAFDVFYHITHFFDPKKLSGKASTEAATFPEPPSRNPVPFVKVGHVPEHRVNEILDKINDQGMESLSPEDREILIRASREDE
ncbi:rhomboid family intramembrane serine protease [Chitinophaga pollutisoli]|uniref:Rhomboid family intramembrane serine protease n=1 Tax=Chitinophaga pollutisoli TaxID=3133966 RepID=A0ABZ2YIE1_9BACT